MKSPLFNASILLRLGLAATFLSAVASRYKTRWAALGAALLTFVFALAMTYSFGIKNPLDYSVFVDCTAAYLLAGIPNYKWSPDEYLKKS